MINSLSKLAALIEEGSVPRWVSDAVETQKDSILRALDVGIPYELNGPKGEVITITPKDRK